MTTTPPKTSHDLRRVGSIRVTARRRGLVLMRRGERFWITREDGEILAGGPTGLNIERVEQMIRREGFGRETQMAAAG